MFHHSDFYLKQFSVVETDLDVWIQKEYVLSDSKVKSPTVVECKSKIKSDQVYLKMQSRFIEVAIKWTRRAYNETIMRHESENEHHTKTYFVTR